MPEIFVEFIPDMTKLESGIDQLVSGGNVTKKLADELKGIQKPLDDVAKKASQAAGSTNKSLDSMSTKVKSLSKSFHEGFAEGVADALKEAGVSAEEFEAALSSLGQKETSLKTELRQMNEELARMKINGEENSQKYKEMAEKAGAYKDAIGDVIQETKRLGSDTRNIDTVIEGISGLAAVGQIAAGGMAIFGEQNKAFEETMIRLNAVMAVANGIQQIQNLLQKESNLIRLVTLGQTKAQVLATNLESAAQSRNIIVKAGATVAMRVLNAVMAANPVLLLIGLFAAFGAALVAFSGKAKQAEIDVDLLNATLEHQKSVLTDNIALLNYNAQVAAERAKKAGASELDLLKIQQNTVAGSKKLYSDYTNERINQLKKLAGVRSVDIKSARDAEDALLQIEETVSKAGGFDKLNEKSQKRIQAARSLVAEIKSGFAEIDKADQQSQLNQASYEAAHALDYLKSHKAMMEARVAQSKQGSREEMDARIAVVEAGSRLELANANLTAGERVKIAADAERQIRDIRFDFATKGLEDDRARVDAMIAAEREGSQKYFELLKQQATAQLAVDLHNQSLSDAKKEQLRAESARRIEQIDIQQQTAALENGKAAMNAQLQAVNIGNDRRLELIKSSLEQERQIRLLAVKNNRSKEAEINAEIDRQISDATLASRQQTADRSAQMAAILDGYMTRNIQHQMDLQSRAAADENASWKSRGDAMVHYYELQRQQIDNNERIQADAITKQIQDLKTNHDDQLISDSDYFLQLAKLEENLSIVHADAESKRTETTKAANDARLQHTKDTVDRIAGFINQGLNAVAGIFDAINQREQQQIQARIDANQQARDAGALTEKEFTERQRRLEVEQKKQQVANARREKAMNLFSAFVNGAAAIVKAAPNPFLIAFTSALVAAQVAAIIATPLPKYGKGTKSARRGFAEIGETGAELIQTDRGYFVADHPQIIWMKGGERVYNPKETKAMFQTPIADRKLINFHPTINAGGGSIDHDKLARSIGQQIAKHPRLNVAIDERGFTTHIADQLSKVKYLHNRYNYNG